jgi:tripartite-type tricarboxylate transporter receptor subunit TctC
VAELIAFAKKNPGKLTHASSGIGSAQHVDAEIFKHAAGIEMVHVPYKGGGPQGQALVAQEIDLSFQPLQQVRPYLQSNKVKVLAYYNGPKPADLPNVPDLAQAVPGFQASPGFIGLLGPAGLPRPVLMRLNAAVVKALNLPDVRAKIEANGAVVVASSPEQFAKELKEGLESAGKAVQAAKAAGVKFE